MTLKLLNRLKNFFVLGCKHTYFFFKFGGFNISAYGDWPFCLKPPSSGLYRNCSFTLIQIQSFQVKQPILI